MPKSRNRRMVRRSKTLRWFCSCCSMDRSRDRRSVRMVKRMAKRREERLWRREMKGEIESD